MDEGELTAVELSADRTTAAVADSITFHYQAVGQRLLGIVLEYGDGAIDSIYAHGAQTAEGDVKHAYEVADTFLATIEALEFSGSTATAQLTIRIEEPSGD